MITTDPFGGGSVSYIIGASGQHIWIEPSMGERLVLRTFVIGIGAMIALGAYGCASEVHFRATADATIAYTVEQGGDELELSHLRVESDTVGVSDVTCSELSCLVTLGTTEDAAVAAIGVVFDQRHIDWFYDGIADEQNLGALEPGRRAYGEHYLALARDPN